MLKLLYYRKVIQITTILVISSGFNIFRSIFPSAHNLTRCSRDKVKPLKVSKDLEISELRLQFSLSDLTGSVYRSQNKKIKEKKFYEVLRPKLKMSEKKFSEKLGKNFLSFSDLRNLKKEYGITLDIYGNHNENFYTADLVFKSFKPNKRIIINDKMASEEKIFFSDKIVEIIDDSYLRPYFCKVSPKCGFTTRKLTDLKRHEKNCSEETLYYYKEVEYGDPRDVRLELIREGIFESDTVFHEFITFDIETFLDSNHFLFGATECQGAQIVVSIAYYSKFGSGCFVKESDTTEDGTKIIELFLNKMIEFQEIHFNSISDKIKYFFEDCKEQLNDENLSVSEKIKLEGYVKYIRRMFNLNVIGLNSSRFDLPCILEHLLTFCDLENIKLIKKGSSVFSLNYESLLFLDISNFFPGSLSSFCKSMGVVECKGVWPYEYYRSVTEIQNSKTYPPVSAFATSLAVIDKSNFLDELKILFSDFKTFGELMNFLGLSLFPEKHNQIIFPDLSPEEQTLLLEKIHISPKDYSIQKNYFNEKIKNKEFNSMTCLLKEYNLNDCKILFLAIKNFNSNMMGAFGTPLLSKLSLPGLAESILWSHFSGDKGLVYSFGRNFGHLNEKVRSGLLGGPGSVQN